MTWKDVTISDFQRLFPVLHSEKSNYDKILEVVSIFDAVPVEVVSNEYTQKDLARKWERYSFIFDKLPEKQPKRIKVNGKVYNLASHPDELVAFQFTDLMAAMKSGDVISNLHTILAVIATEKGKKYDGGSLSARAAEFRKHCAITEAYPTAVFFCRVLTIMYQDSRQLAVKRAVEALDSAENSLTDMDGLSPSMRSQIQMYLKLRKLDITRSAHS
jgi:hypothetical protein